MKDAIKIKGARTHNLKDVSLEIPKNKLVIFSGVSGSGKSSLAFDTIFAEGQRRYIESLSPYARQFLGQMEKPDVDEIEGLSPAIAIDQKAHSHNPRSTVATLTEIYDYLRVLFARIGKPFCPECGSEIKKMSADEIADFLEETAARENAPVATVLAPVVRGRKGEYFQLLQDLFSDGFGEARIDGKFYSLRERIELPRYKMHTIEIVVDRVPLADRQRLFEAVETAIERGGGLVGAVFPSGKEFVLSSLLSCPRENFSLPEIEPRLFSFNSPYGACEGCHGIGHDFIDINDLCSACGGRRLKKEALAVKITGRNISDLTSLTIDEAYEFFATLDDHLSENEKLIAKNVLKEIIARLEFLLEVGLDYIALNRESWTLSGG
ncbi:MAG: ABC-ATPase UvrA, partial [Parcubacteria group bacterium]|nr:ABC-ATPase UvrA [Parcubacteria group bacterium]